MDVHYQCNFADYKELQKAQIRKPSATPVLLFGAIFFTFLAVSSLRHDKPLLASGYALVSMFALLPPSLRLFQRLLMKRCFSESGFGGGAHMSCNDVGIEIEDESEKQETKWAAFTKFQETENLFILYKVGKLQVVPKRFFAQNELEEFRSLLVKKIQVGN